MVSRGTRSDLKSSSGGIVKNIHRTMPQYSKGRYDGVGRMAFANYITHTVICTTTFYGHGFDLFGKARELITSGLPVIQEP